MATLPPLAETTRTDDALTSAVFHFDHDHRLPHDDLVHLLGGKGAGLAEMATELGLPVPPGFTVSVPVCRDYLNAGRPDSDSLREALIRFASELGDRMGRHLGDPRDPLLVAVRSGAPVSMPGMLDTVLNLGLNDETVGGLAEISGNGDFAWDSYRRFLSMYAVTVMGVDAEALGTTATFGEGDPRAQVHSLQRTITELAGRAVPHDPHEQLTEAVEAVFRSWNSTRAQVYREREHIDPNLGTAVTVQAMVFGNRGPTSGTGVVFTRNPSTGARELFGDYLPMAQGEDVVAGTAKTLDINDLRGLHPTVYDELTATLRRLEVHFRDMCDVEFTVEEGKLWLLQTRVGKRGAQAAVRIAIDLTADPAIRLSREEVLDRVPVEVRERAHTETLDQATERVAAPPALTTALGASPGRAVGRAVFNADAALEAPDAVILVRPETCPEDVAGMSVSAGLLTTKGGLVSHAAVVARGWGIPAVVGAHDLVFHQNRLESPDGTVIHAGEIITIDGSSGNVWLGDTTQPADDRTTAALERHLPELMRINQWAQEMDSTDQ